MPAPAWSRAPHPGGAGLRRAPTNGGAPRGAAGIRLCPCGLSVPGPQGWEDGAGGGRAGPSLGLIFGYRVSATRRGRVWLRSAARPRPRPRPRPRGRQRAPRVRRHPLQTGCGRTPRRGAPAPELGNLASRPADFRKSPADASASLTCPKEMSGFEGDTLTVRCTYGEELRTRSKYWCREGGLIISRCSRKISVGENGQEARQGRVSIRDSPQELVLTVTLRDLTLADSGKYWCGASNVGLGYAFPVSLKVFPGAERPGATTRACCPPSPAPSFRPPLAATASLRPRAGAQPPQAPAPTSPDRHPTVAAPQQGHGGVEALPHTETATSRHTATSSHTATSPHAAAASPPAGSSRPAVVPDFSATAPGDPDPVSSSLSSMPSMYIPTARQLAPVLVLLSLLLATGVISLGAHVLRGRRSALLASGTPRGEKVHFSAAAQGWEEGPVPCTASEEPGCPNPEVIAV
ncbi:PREDICTED: CMRF35-like molecule 9 [Chinchilla lanigera]|uniref:CMRF35-like molecule 9 n=1 Tax=Chinchilla lanigera TaxID=34839 RepID=UPI00038ED910|nr:PREDICTED: CMRF35-like molecule 9 [Chinchilla lanigera]